MNILIITTLLSLFILVATTIFTIQRAVNDALQTFMILQNNKFYDANKSNVIVIGKYQLKTKDNIDNYVNKLTLNEAEREDMRSGLYRIMGVK